MNEMSIPTREVSPPASAQSLPLPTGRADMDLREMLRLLWRQRWLMAVTVIAVMLLTGLALFETTPRYTATAKVMVDPRQANVLDLEQVISGLPINAETVQSEIEVIYSSDLATRVIDYTGLARVGEFNSALNPSGWRSWLGGDASAPDENTVRTRIMSRYRNALDVKVAGRSRVINIAFTSTNPVLAAEVANATAELYLSGQLQAKFDATLRASKWLTERLNQLRIEAESAELAVSRFRSENHIGGIAPDREVTFKSQVAEAAERLAASQSRLTALQALHGLAANAAPPENWPDDTLKSLHEAVVQLEEEHTQLATELGPRHPRMVDLESRITTARNNYDTALNQQLVSSEAEVRTDTEKLKSLQETQKQVELVADPGEAQVRLRTLERQAQASRALYETFLSRAKETSEQTGLAENGLLQADARLISQAEIPNIPSFPNNKLFMLMALVAGVGLALVLAFMAEQLDSGFRSSDQLEAQLGLPTIAILPSLRSLGVRDQTPEEFLKLKPASAFAEAVRMLRTALLLANVDAPPKVLMVTSAVPGEGKTTTILALARLAALSGERVVVVDADIRRPRIHDALKVENGDGLVEILSGKNSLEKALHSSEPDGKGFHYLTAGRQTPQTTDLIRSQQFKALIQRLSGLYDLVLIDSPPVLPVADAKMLTSLVDRVIYVVRWNNVRREVVAHAVKQLRDVGANFAGVVMNNVNVRRHAEYGYGDSGYYYGRQRKYYTD